MKKHFLSIIFILFSISAFSQFKVNYGQLEPAPDPNNLPLNIWVKMKGEIKAYEFKKNAVGVMRAMNLAKEILKANDMDFNKYEFDESLLSSTVKGWDDYENLHYTISLGNSVIQRVWKKGTEMMVLSLDDEHYVVAVSPIKLDLKK